MIKASSAVVRLGASQRGLGDRLPKPRVAKMVKLSSGGPSFATPAYVVAAATRAMQVDLDAVRRAVTPKTRMLVLNYPSNPTGQLLDPGELDGLAAIAEQYDLVVLADEAYDQLVFQGEHHSVLGHPGLTARSSYNGTVGGER